MGTNVVNPESVLEQIRRARLYNPSFATPGAAPTQVQTPQQAPIQAPIQAPPSPRDQALAEYRQTLQQAPSQADYHPSITRRVIGSLLGGLVGMTGKTNPQAIPQGANLAHEVVYSPYEKQLSDYQQKLAQKKQAYETEMGAEKESALETEEQARTGAERERAAAETARRKGEEFKTSPEGQQFELNKLKIEHPNVPKVPVPYELELKNGERVIAFEGQGGQFKDAQDNIYGPDSIKTAYKVGTEPKPAKETALKPEREGEAGAIDAWTSEHGRAPNYAERKQIHSDWDTAGRKPETGGAKDIANEFKMQSAREIAQRPHQRNLDLATQQLDRINRSIAEVDTSKPEDLALAIPSILTALVSGQGTGVRITTPEMNNIIHARGFGDSVEAFVNKIKGSGNLSAKQKADLKGLLSDVQAKVAEKQRDISDLMDKIDTAENPNDIGKAQIEYRKKLLGTGTKSETKTETKGATPKTKEDFLKLLETK